MKKKIEPSPIIIINISGDLTMKKILNENESFKYLTELAKQQRKIFSNRTINIKIEKL
jgi:ArsR family metal-binding transcriptional regulator